MRREDREMAASDGRQAFARIIESERDHASTAQDLIMTAVRRAILTGALLPGNRLRQEDLADRFSVSRIPVREALRALEHEGLVTSEPHRGFTVSTLDADDVEEVYELRTVLESHAVRIAVSMLTEEDLAELDAHFGHMQAASSPDEQLAARERFYLRLYSVTGRPRLVGLITRLRQEVARVLRWATIQHSAAVHEQFWEAVRTGDAEGAATVLANHYRRVALLIRRRLKEEAMPSLSDSGRTRR